MKRAGIRDGEGRAVRAEASVEGVTRPVHRVLLKGGGVVFHEEAVGSNHSLASLGSVPESSITSHVHVGQL
jgi:hypothetical protein